MSLCKQCRKETSYSKKKKKDNDFCSFSCRATYFNILQYEERKSKLAAGIKKKWEDPKYRTQMSEKAKNDVIHAQNGWRKKYDENPEFRQSVFDRCIDAYEINTKFKRIYFYSGITMKSSYEVNFASFLDKNDIKWDYEPEKFFYRKNEQNRCYIPDFFISALNLYVEVKSEWWMNEETKDRLFLVESRGHSVCLIKEDNWNEALSKILMITNLRLVINVYEFMLRICPW